MFRIITCKYKAVHIVVFFFLNIGTSILNSTRDHAITEFNFGLLKKIDIVIVFTKRVSTYIFYIPIIKIINDNLENYFAYVQLYEFTVYVYMHGIFDQNHF